MKRQVLSVLAFEIAMISLASVAIAQAISPTRRIAEIMSRKCNQSTEVSYQSKQLVSPDQSTQVHFEGTLRRVSSNHKNESGIEEISCYAEKRQTVIEQIVIDKQGKATVFDLFSYDDGYIVLEPISFSPNGQYLVASADTVYAGAHTSFGIGIFNLNNGQIIHVLDMCSGLIENNTDDVSYIGFASEAEMIVECQPSQHPREEVRPNRFESINLESGTVRHIAKQPDRAASHGTTLGYFEITKVQRFE